MAATESTAPLPEIPEKTCRTCTQVFPATTAYFHRRTRTGRLHPDCRWCRQAKRKRPPRVRMPSAPDGHKKCSSCQQIFPATTQHFSRNKSTNDGLAAYCYPCRRANDRSRLGQRRVYQQQQRELHPERQQRANKKWRDTHPETVQALNHAYRTLYPERVRESGRLYCQRHPEKIRIKAVRRRTRKLALPVHYTAAMWQAACAYFAYTCAVCGREEGFFWTLAQDHWIPLSAPNCPGTIASNIVPLCHAKAGHHSSCNPTKLNRTPLVWLTDKLGPRKARETLTKIDAFLTYMEQRFPT